MQDEQLSRPRTQYTRTQRSKEKCDQMLCTQMLLRRKQPTLSK